MRKWIVSACALAWLALALVAAASLRGSSPAQASSGTVVSSNASRTAITTSNANSTAVPASAADGTQVTLARGPAALKAGDTPARRPSRPASHWTVRPGDTLSGIAAALGLRGGWPALYTANKAAIGPDPDVIQAGTVLAVPGAGVPARYTVAPGDTLSGIAAALGLRGGWPALYTANKAAIGPDPNVIRAGAVLAAPRPSAPAPRHGTAPTTLPARTPATSGTSRPANPARPGPPGGQPAARATSPGHATMPSQAQAPGQPAAPGRTPAPGRADAPGQLTPAGGMPRWLQDVLLAAGVLAATAFVAEPAAALARRRHLSGPAVPRPAPSAPPRGPSSPPRGPARRAARRAKITLASYERLIVTYSAHDHAVYVLTPPGEDPATVLRAARLVLPEDTYEDLAGRLGVPSGWPLE